MIESRINWEEMELHTLNISLNPIKPSSLKVFTKTKLIGFQCEGLIGCLGSKSTDGYEEKLIQQILRCVNWNALSWSLSSSASAVGDGKFDEINGFLTQLELTDKELGLITNQLIGFRGCSEGDRFQLAIDQLTTESKDNIEKILYHKSKHVLIVINHRKHEAQHLEHQKRNGSSHELPPASDSGIDACLLSSRLLHLDVTAMGLDDKSFEIIASSCSGLKLLCASDNHMTKDGARYLSTRLSKLAVLELSRNRVGDVGLWALCGYDEEKSKLKGYNLKLSHLLLDENGLTHLSLTELPDTYKNQTIQVLSLARNSLTDEAVRRLFEMYEGLVSVNLDRTEISDDSISEVAASSQVRFLSLNGTKVTDSGYEKLIHHASLLDLSLLEGTPMKVDTRQLLREQCQLNQEIHGLSNPGATRSDQAKNAAAVTGGLALMALGVAAAVAFPPLAAGALAAEFFIPIAGTTAVSVGLAGATISGRQMMNDSRFEGDVLGKRLAVALVAGVVTGGIGAGADALIGAIGADMAGQAASDVSIDLILCNLGTAAANRLVEQFATGLVKSAAYQSWEGITESVKVDALISSIVQSVVFGSLEIPQVQALMDRIKLFCFPSSDEAICYQLASTGMTGITASTTASIIARNSQITRRHDKEKAMMLTLQEVETTAEEANNSFPTEDADDKDGILNELAEKQKKELYRAIMSEACKLCCTGIHMKNASNK